MLLFVLLLCHMLLFFCFVRAGFVCDVVCVAAVSIVAWFLMFVLALSVLLFVLLLCQSLLFVCVVICAGVVCVRVCVVDVSLVVVCLGCCSCRRCQSYCLCCCCVF